MRVIEKQEKDSKPIMIRVEFENMATRLCEYMIISVIWYMDYILEQISGKTGEMVI